VDGIVERSFGYRMAALDVVLGNDAVAMIHSNQALKKANRSS
jgi:hypothetical protein